MSQFSRHITTQKVGDSRFQSCRHTEVDHDLDQSLANYQMQAVSQSTRYSGNKVSYTPHPTRQNTDRISTSVNPLLTAPRIWPAGSVCLPSVANNDKLINERCFRSSPGRVQIDPQGVLGC